MTSLPSTRKKKIPTLFVPLTKAEKKDLKNFCLPTVLTEIPQKQWVNHLSNLELNVPIFIASQQGRDGGCLEINFSRTIFSTEFPEGQKVKTKLVINWPPNTHDGNQFHFPQFGDQKYKEVGTLVVTIKFKKTVLS